MPRPRHLDVLPTPIEGSLLITATTPVLAPRIQVLDQGPPVGVVWPLSLLVVKQVAQAGFATQAFELEVMVGGRPVDSFDFGVIAAGAQETIQRQYTSPILIHSGQQFGFRFVAPTGMSFDRIEYSTR